MDEKEPLEIKLKKLEFYRSEIQHEYTLLYSRVSTYVTSQSFLTIAFASAMSNRSAAGNQVFSLWFPILLSLIGIITSLTVRGGVNGSVDTIGLWHVKQNKLFENDPLMDDYLVTLQVKSKNPLDKKNRHSLEFAQIMPYVFLISWCLFGLLDIYLHIK